MMWTVLFDGFFAEEFHRLEKPVQDAILAHTQALERQGPNLPRPFADTLAGSRHANMKELRPTVNKVEWRVAFAFDPKRRAILLTAVVKSGRGGKRAYERLIRTADARFDEHLKLQEHIATTVRLTRPLPKAAD